MTRFAFAAGSVLVGGDGAVVEVVDPRRGESMLLREGAGGLEGAIHRPERRWGKGFVIADGRGLRFDAPAELSATDGGVALTHRWDGLELAIERRFGERWTETYELRNVSERTTAIGSFAISTPWRDLYEPGESLRRAVHAHVWTGGAGAWVWAIPMDGAGPGLGLRLLEGELWAYSIESRDQVTSSNVRGHIYLHATDHARAPHAFGGQPELTLAPGASLRLRWELAWHADLDAFHAARAPAVRLDACAAEVGAAIVVAGRPVTATRPGIRHVDVGRERVAVLFHPPLRELAEARVRFLLDRQRPLERADSRRHAFVPYDNESGLRVLAGAWEDWSDGRERIGSALLLQECARRGWGRAEELAEALAGYHRFVTEHLVRPDGTVLDDAGPRERPRLYDFPWFARFLLDHGDAGLAARVMERFYALGGERFLAFELGTVMPDLAAALRARGDEDAAAALTARLLAQARASLADDLDLPAHEVAYEQSIVAPLLDLLIAARRLDPGLVEPEHLLTRLGWLTAFAADQPDARLRHMPIRHWDGYWFGRLRLWGDVFPHYWSVLSAAVYLTFPEELLEPERARRLRDAGRAILRGNLAAFGEDGSASCAFVYPSCVDGRPAHVADPLANDQDWALVYALRFGI